MKTLKTFILMILVFFVFPHGLVADENRNTFSFVALGDTAYTEDSYDRYEALIQTINESNAEFSIHVGDTLGYQPCDRNSDQQISSFFARFQEPVVYTPGDNEWRDCELEVDDKTDSSDKKLYAFKLERLDRLRQLYFSNAESLGQTKMSVTRQSDVSEFKESVENAYWIHNEVLFGTLHVIGSGNGLNPWSEAMSLEGIRRARANAAWIETITEIVAEKDLKAVVLAMHAGLFDEGRTSPFTDELVGTRIREGYLSAYGHTMFALLPLFDGFERPILIIHGDYHEFIVDRPFLTLTSETDPAKNKNAHVTRLQVFGAPELKAVKVGVDTDTPWVFSFSPLY